MWHKGTGCRAALVPLHFSVKLLRWFHNMRNGKLIRLHMTGKIPHLSARNRFGLARNVARKILSYFKSMHLPSVTFMPSCRSVLFFSSLRPPWMEGFAMIGAVQIMCCFYQPALPASNTFSSVQLYRKTLQNLDQALMNLVSFIISEPDSKDPPGCLWLLTEFPMELLRIFLIPDLPQSGFRGIIDF